MSRSLPPRVVGPFEIVGKLGGGGMAAVFLGRRRAGPQAGQVAAIKVMLAELAADEQFSAMFADEGKLLSRLDHPNISRTLEVGSANHVGYIAMEVLLGRTLADVWDAAKVADVPFRFDVAAWIAAEVARGLHYAHELRDEDGSPFRLIHRDVNPSNIFLGYDGAIKLFDFGLAKAKGRRARTEQGIVKGKVAYLSPEQLQQVQIDHRSDIFSLGTTLWEMTTLSRLFKRDRDIDTVMAIRDHAVPDPRLMVDGYPDALWSTVRRALSRDRDQRHESAKELADELQRFVRSEGLDDMAGFVAAMVERLFPGEREKQVAWLAQCKVDGALTPETVAPPAPILSMPPLRIEVSVPMPLLRRGKPSGPHGG